MPPAFWALVSSSFKWGQQYLPHRNVVMTINVYLAHGSYSVNISIHPPMGKMRKSKEREAGIEREGRRTRATMSTAEAASASRGLWPLCSLVFSPVLPTQFPLSLTVLGVGMSYISSLHCSNYGLIKPFLWAYNQQPHSGLPKWDCHVGNSVSALGRWHWRQQMWKMLWLLSPTGGRGPRKDVGSGRLLRTSTVCQEAWFWPHQLHQWVLYSFDSQHLIESVHFCSIVAWPDLENQLKPGVSSTTLLTGHLWRWDGNMLVFCRLSLQYQHPKKTAVLDWAHCRLSLKLFSFLLIMHQHAVISAGTLSNYLLETRGGVREDGSGKGRREEARERWFFSLGIINTLSTMSTWLKGKNSEMVEQGSWILQ